MRSGRMSPNPKNASHQERPREDSMVPERRVERFGGKMTFKAAEVALVFGPCELMYGVKL